jgi:hypothetical protein
MPIDAGSSQGGHTALDHVVRSWANVDYDRGIGAERFYSENAVFETPAAQWRGRAQIAAGHATRTRNGPRLTRHLIHNAVVGADGDLVVACYVVLLYGENGVAPMRLTGASAICDVRDELIATPAGWLIRRRSINPVFVTAENDSAVLGTRGPHGSG